MCFVLYAGTSKPLPQKEWRDEAPDVVAMALSDTEAPIAAHFSKPEVQYICSTAGCGCDFPYVMHQNGDWPGFNDDATDAEEETTYRYNREALVALLRSTGEASAELYGVWDGGFDFTTPPLVREEISVKRILETCFRFKEQGFYIVDLA